MRKDRLLNVAKALRESPNPDRFGMSWWAWSCKTPACAMGHYAARPDLQSDFWLTEHGTLACAGGILDSICDHFDIERAQYNELFEFTGCGDAKTVEQAAEYIEAFVARHEGKP